MKFCPACNNKFDDNVSFCPKDGEVLEEDPTSFVGSVLDGQYQVEALLGKGAGTTFNANEQFSCAVPTISIEGETHCLWWARRTRGLPR